MAFGSVWRAVLAGLLVLWLGAVVPGALVSSAEGAPTCTKRGTARSETIRGTSGRDVLCGLGGNDVLLGFGGDDVLLGGDGNDRLLGGLGSDVFTGGRGTDTVSYSDHTAAVRVTIGSLANDGTRGEGDNVQADIERVDGTAGGDKLFAGSRAAQLRGLGGPDRLTGGPARDILVGGSGNDYLDGKALGDTYKCGSGFDTWVKSGADLPTIDCEDQAGNQAPNGIGFDHNGDVFENQPAGTLVDTLNASDPDPGDTLTFSLPAGVFDNDLFSIVGKQLRTAEIFDHETTPELQIRIRVTDKAGLSFAVTAPIPVKDLNDAPTPANDQVSGQEDTQRAILFTELLENDSDPDAGINQLFVTSAQAPLHGSVDFQPVDDRVIFTPDADFCGSGGFDYTVQDSQLATGTAHVEVVVACANDGGPAGVVERQHAVTGNVAIQVPAPALLVGVTDVDETDVLAVTEAAGASAQGGSFDVNADGSYTYVPPAGYTGADSFPYQVCDNGSDPQACASASVILTVTNMAWFVDNEASPGGDGSLAAPFASLAQFQAVNNNVGNNPGNGEPVFLAASGTPYVGPVVLLSGQRLIGAGSSVPLAQAAGLTLAPDSVPMPPTGLAPPQINTVGGNAVQVVQNNVVRGVRVGGSSGGWGLYGLNFGALTVTEVAVVAGRGAISLEGGSLSGTGFTEVGASGTPIAVRLVNVDGPIELGTGILAADETALLVQGGSGSVTYAGQVLGFGSPAALIVESRLGLVTLSGLVQDFGPGPGIVYTGVNLGTLRLTGGVSVTAATGTALNATGGGKIEVTGDQNTLNAVGAPALVVNGGTLIGFQGVKFQSISSSNASSGIVLDGTGIEGRLMVTGTGPAGSGGTIGGSTGPGISLTNTWTPFLGGMVIENSGSHGISASGVTNLQLAGSRIDNNGNAAGEHGVLMVDPLGTQTSLVGNTFVDSADRQVLITSGAGNRTVRLSTNTFTSPGGTLHGGIEIEQAGSGSTHADLYFSTIRGAVGDAISLRGDGVGATLTGRITSSLIGEVATAGSGSSDGSGIKVLGLNGSPVRVLIQSNFVVQYADYGILAGTSGGNSNAHVIIGNNTIQNPGATALNGVNVVAGQNATSGTLCLAAEQNTLTGSAANGQEEFQVSQADPDVAVVLPGYAGAAHDLSAVENFLKATAPATTADALSTGSGAGFVNGAFCTLPPA